MQNDRVWQAVLGEMEVVLSKMNFSTWFKETTFIKDGETGIVLTPHPFAKTQLESRYQKEILAVIQKVDPEIKRLKFEVKQLKPNENMVLEIKARPAAPRQAPLGPQQQAQPPATSLNDAYTFDNFVVGNNNALAYAVAKEVAGNPGKKHNPLFIYGGVGLGKTHLAQAIGNELVKASPKSKAVYVSCETFTNDFIGAIASKKMSQFKKTYREVDVLIVDDIQFLSAKEGSQEEFFHTYNALHQRSRQIIMTADKIPQAIPALEGRLASRFGGGMVVDIQPPNLETRMAILRGKCKDKGFVVNDDVIEYIARNIPSNIRELEGALNRLATHCEFNSIPATTALATEILKDFVSSNDRTINPAQIVAAVCKYFEIRHDELISKTRKKELIRPRQIAIFLIREQTSASFPDIGKMMGGKDHSTIMHSHKRIESSFQIDLLLKSDLEKIRQMLSSLNA